MSNTQQSTGNLVSNYLNTSGSGTAESNPGAGSTESTSSGDTKYVADDMDDIEVVHAGSHRNEDDGLFGSEESSESSDKTNPTDSSAQAKSADGKTTAKSESAEQKKQATPGNKDVITVTDDKGKRKVEIDYDNKEAIKQAFAQAAGFRKMQAERDAARSAPSVKEQEAKYKALEQNWNTLEAAYKQGPEAVFDIMSGKQGAFQDVMNKALARQKILDNNDPDEIAALHTRELAEKNTKELEKLRQENAEFKSSVQKERETAELKALESKVLPAFDKYRFANKLGDTDTEHLFDTMLWNTVLERLEPYEEQGLEVTPTLIDKEFREVAVKVRKHINQQADKRATQVVEQKKQEATESVQSKVMSGYKTSNTNREAQDLLNAGNLTAVMRGWAKYGQAFGKQRK